MIELPDNVGTKRLEQAQIDELIAQHQVFLEREAKSDHGGERLKLVEIDLRDIDLGDKPLSRAIFERVNLDGHTFRGNAMQNCLFSGCNLEGVTFDHVDLTSTNFRERSILDRAEFHVDRLKNVAFQKVTFDRAVFRIEKSGPESVVHFNDCEAAHADMKGCNLSYARFAIVSFRQCEFASAILDHAEFSSRSRFYDCRFDGASLQHARFDDVHLQQCSLCGANLHQIVVDQTDFGVSDFTGARWSAASIQRTMVRGADFTAPIDILAPFGATFGSITGAEWVKYSKSLDLCSWALVRTVGAIPLFGVSYLAILAIVLWAGAVEWYNRQVVALKGNEITTEIVWIERLNELPASREFFYMLVALLILAAGATVYRFRCPDIIKEHTESQWQYVHHYEVVVYRLHSYSRFWWRWISGICYAVGGTWVSWHVAVRVWRALRFLFSL